MTPAARAGGTLLAVLAAVALAAPALAPHDPGRQFTSMPYAPPMRPHVIDDEGGWHAPFVYAVRLADPLERRYVEERARRVPLFAGSDDQPVFLLGSDALGRDVFSRLLYGARLSLGVAAGATLVALLLGALVGAAAGYRPGWTDDALMRVTDLAIVLPGIYVVLALRAALPLVLSTPQVFAAMVGVLGLVGWPSAARGVRGIVAVERSQEYAEAARAAGAGSWQILRSHLLPATRGFLLAQAGVLLPAFILAEATLSFVGLGFAPPVASWGAMLQDAAAVRVVSETPWLLAPAAAIVVSVLCVHVSLRFRSGAAPIDF